MGMLEPSEEAIEEAAPVQRSFSLPLTIVLTSEPKSTQHVYKFTSRPFPRMYMTAEGKAIKEDYGWQAKSQWKEEPLKGDVAIYAIFYYGSRRKFDLDNANKLWADALSGIVYEDDNQIASLFLKRRYHKEKRVSKYRYVEEIASTNGWQTAINLSTIARFNRFYGDMPIKNFDGGNRIDYYRQVPINKRLQFKEVPNSFVFNEALLHNVTGLRAPSKNS